MVIFNQDGGVDRSDIANLVREDLNLSNVLSVIQDIKNEIQKGNKGFAHYYKVSASEKSNISVESIFNRYLPLLERIQKNGLKASDLNAKEIAQLHDFVREFSHQLRTLSKVPKYSQYPRYRKEAAPVFEGYYKKFLDIYPNEILTQLYDIDNPSKPKGSKTSSSADAFTNESIREVEERLKALGDWLDSLSDIFEGANSTWSEIFNALEATYTEFKLDLSTFDINDLFGTYKRLRNISQMIIPHLPEEATTSLMTPFGEKYDEYLRKADLFFTKFKVSRLFNDLNIITKDMEVINALAKTMVQWASSYGAGSRIGAMFTEATGISDTKDGKIGKALGMAGSALGGAIGGALGGPLGAVAGKVVGSTIVKAMSEKSGGPLAMITGILSSIASMMASLWKMLKKSSPILQAIGQLFNLAMILFFMPFGNAIGTILLPLLETLVEFAIAFNDIISSYYEPIADAITKQFYRIFGLSLILLETISPLIADIAGFIGNIVALMLTAVTNAVTWFVDAWPTLMVFTNKILEYFTSGDFYKMLTNLITTLVPSIIEIVSTILEKLPDIIDFISDLVTKKIPDILTEISNIFKVVSPISNFLEKISKALGIFENVGGTDVQDFGEKVLTGLEAGWEFAKKGGIIGWGLRQLGITPLATGGIVTSPTLSLIGESGPEAVVPLSEGGFGTSYNIYISGDIYGVSDLEARIERVIQRTANKSNYR